ncbi:uncharacterized protein LOC125591916 [Brassica napus]|uniref:uncharacterized protein LOC125591916 n=1 Tax=Brassica napus TaxID=3708 RepID=UPI0006AAA944|nr:uncharacterized protein LOC125591916 [Brassica napus]
MAPKLDELKEALAFCPLWSFEKRKWLGLLLLQAMGVYCFHHNSRIPFESAIRVFDDEAMGSYPWGRTAYEVRVRRMVLKDSIEEMFPKWPGEPDDPQLVSLITVIHGFVKGFRKVQRNAQRNAQGKGNEKKKKMKGGILSEAEPPTKKQKKVKTQNEVNNIEGKLLQRERVLARRKIDSRFDAYELERNRPLMDQKTIDDMVKGLVEERLKVLGKIPKNYDNLSNGGEEESLPSPQQNTQQKSVNSPALVDETPGKDTGVKRTLAEEFDKDTGVKRTLAEEFGKDTGWKRLWLRSLATKDDKDAKVLAYGRGCRGRRTVKDEDATDKKKAVQAEAALKRKEKADAKRKEAALKKQKLAELKNQEAEAKRKEAELKKQKLAELKKQKHVELKKQKHAGEDSECAVTNDGVLGEENKFAPESDVENQEVVRSAVVKECREKRVQLSPKGFALMIVSSPPVFPYIGDDGTTCMRKNVKPSSAIYDPLAPIDPVLFEKLMQHIKGFPPKPPAPADKPAVLPADHESDFYSILIHERPWPEKEYGWVFDNHVGAYINVLIKRSMRNPTPFWSKRIAFIDVWVLSFWIHDFKQFKIKPSMITFKGNGYEDLINGKLPLECPTNLKWYEDVDHLYGCLQTGGNHWVAFHVDLKKEKID